jgi:hypothetical protein
MEAQTSRGKNTRPYLKNPKQKGLEDGSSGRAPEVQIPLLPPTQKKKKKLKFKLRLMLMLILNHSDGLPPQKYLRWKVWELRYPKDNIPSSQPSRSPAPLDLES